MIYTVTLNPALDKSVTVENFLPNAVNRISKVRVDAGGKGINVSKVLISLGCPSVATGFLGGAAGEAITRALSTEKIENAFIRIEGETRTNIKIFDPVRHTYTDINEPGPEISAAATDELIKRLRALAKAGDTVLFAGSSPKGVADELPARWAEELLARGVLIAADLDGARLNFMVEKKPDTIKPNARELQELCGLPDIKPETLAFAARELVRSGIRRVAVSMGADGALFADAEGVLLARGPYVNAISTVGAGDTLMAALLYADTCGLDRCSAAEYAVGAATAKVTCPGSSPPTRAQIERYSRLTDILNF